MSLCCGFGFIYVLSASFPRPMITESCHVYDITKGDSPQREEKPKFLRLTEHIFVPPPSFSAARPPRIWSLVSCAAHFARFFIVHLTRLPVAMPPNAPTPSEATEVVAEDLVGSLSSFLKQQESEGRSKVE